MARLIDADAWIESHCEGCKYKENGICTKEDPVCGSVQLMNEAATIDAVPVVRCKDCKHYMTIHCTCDGCCISDDWFCADGERKDNG